MKNILKIYLLALLTFTTCNLQVNIKDYIDKGFDMPHFTNPHTFSKSNKPENSNTIYIPSTEEITLTVPIHKTKYFETDAKLKPISGEEINLFSTQPSIQIKAEQIEIKFKLKESAEPSSNNSAGKITLGVVLIRKDINKTFATKYIDIICNSKPKKPEISYQKTTDTFYITKPNEKDIKNVKIQIEAPNNHSKTIQLQSDFDGTPASYKIEDLFSDIQDKTELNGNRSCSVTVYDKAGLKNLNQATGSYTEYTTGGSSSSQSHIKYLIGKLFSSNNPETTFKHSQSNTTTIPYMGKANSNKNISIYDPKVILEDDAELANTKWNFSFDNWLNTKTPSNPMIVQLGINTGNKTELKIKNTNTNEEKTFYLQRDIAHTVRLNRKPLTSESKLECNWTNALGNTVTASSEDINTFVANEAKLQITAIPANNGTNASEILTELKGDDLVLTGGYSGTISSIESSKTISATFTKIKDDNNLKYFTFSADGTKILKYDPVDNTTAKEIDLSILKYFNGVIPEKLFQYRKFTTLTLPESVTEIQANALAVDTIDTLILKSTTPPRIKQDSISFNNITKIKVPQGSLQQYKSTPVWVLAVNLEGY